MESIKTGKYSDLPLRWAVIQDYLDCNLNMEAISEKHSISVDKVRDIVSSTYKEFQNVRESKLILYNQNSSPDYIVKIKSEYIDPERINKDFLDRLSPFDSDTLTDYEMLFCEYFVDRGDEVLAIQESGLDVGLNKDSKAQYRNAIILRAFFLKRKNNVKSYIDKLKELKAQEIEENTKGKVQVELLSLIEKLRGSNDVKSMSSILRAIELLGKTKGIFEERQVIEYIDADSALDRILQRAREAKSTELSIMEDGTEIYQ